MKGKCSGGGARRLWKEPVWDCRGWMPGQGGVGRKLPSRSLADLGHGVLELDRLLVRAGTLGSSGGGGRGLEPC